MKIIITLFLFSLFSTATLADAIVGRVLGVADGDSITVLDTANTQLKIRLSGIMHLRKQAFGNVSKKSLSDLVYDKEGHVEWHIYTSCSQTLNMT